MNYNSKKLEDEKYYRRAVKYFSRIEKAVEDIMEESRIIKEELEKLAYPKLDDFEEDKGPISKNLGDIIVKPGRRARNLVRFLYKAIMYEKNIYEQLLEKLKRNLSEFIDIQVLKYSINRDEIEVLKKDFSESVEKFHLLLYKIKNHKNEIIRGIYHSLEYLSLDSEKRKEYKFDEEYSGWGLFEKVIGFYSHSGKRCLWFAIIGDESKIIGEEGGWFSKYYDSASAKGKERALYAGRSSDGDVAVDNKCGWFSEFHDESKSGNGSGWFSIYRDKSRAGYYYDGSDGEGLSFLVQCENYAGWFSEFYDDSYAEGKHNGMYSKYYDRSQARRPYKWHKHKTGEYSKFLGKYEGPILVRKDKRKR